MRPHSTERHAATGVVVGVAAAVAVALALHRARRLRRRVPPEDAIRSAGRQPVLATLPTEVEGRPWYRAVVVTDCSALCGCARSERVVALHLGSADNPPESLVRLRRAGGEWEPVPGELLKRYAKFSLLAFTWLPAFCEGSRALLVGLGGGSLVHFWGECVDGGASLRVDAVEIDGAVLAAARAHLGLSRAEASGRVRCHVADGAAFLREADDETYDLLMVDLDMGSLLPAQPAAGADAGADAGLARRRAPDVARDMYRVLTDRGVLALNEYSEDPKHVRLQKTLQAVRRLRRFFPEVHVVRATPCNTLFFAPVQRSASPDTFLAETAASTPPVGGVDLGALLATLPPSRCQVYC